MQADETDERFWERKPLSAMTPAEWESLCDGCGKCCLVKLQDADTDEISYTDVACKLLDCDSCRCSDYPNRKKIVPDCVVLSVKLVSQLKWMPSTCAYRLLNEGRPLYWWHPLVSGDANTVHEAGISVRGRAISETVVDDEELLEHIVDWPA
ncbi:YcgN family cysteine cluster protein [Thalassobaculum sp. OXR-137]|uniref:YcgN family cysteine cluster protein n=1 Tax=Thalassobaculum sp. OXR-137 TaxID=3100173 RepID=UPI002AC9033A|nr:YcgN family cysteine cluster protein [Thalassobaculum sp. OXR-137]WPZ32538.1 YcgN family cysteine cluster protein [Thalassobaculum sp. OXR-137]